MSGKKYPIAYVKRKGEFVQIKNPAKTSQCYFCGATVRVSDPKETNVCPICLDLAKVVL